MFTKFKVFFLVFSILSLLTVFFTFFHPHLENDEVIYKTLAKKVSVRFSLNDYNLRNTEILKILPKQIYNTKVFFRPPVFVFILALFYRLFGNLGFAILPALTYLLLIYLIYKTTLIISRSKESAFKAFFISSVSPLFLFSSQKIQIDLFLTLMIMVAFYFLASFIKKGGAGKLLISGLFMTAAILTKYNAILALPFFAYYLISKNRTATVLKQIVLFSLPLLLSIPLFIFIFKNNVNFLRLLSSPNNEMVERFPFVAYVFHRPFYFYFLNIFVVNPLYIFIPYLLVNKRSKINFFIVIILIILLAFTIYGLTGGTYQMRFILMVEPFLIMTLALSKLDWKRYLPLIILFIFHNFFLYFINAVIYQNAELFSFLELLVH